MVNPESTPNTIGRITLDAKQAGKRSAGNPHAAFDEAGTGNGATPATAPVPDPTERGALGNQRPYRAQCPEDSLVQYTSEYRITLLQLMVPWSMLAAESALPR